MKFEECIYGLSEYYKLEIKLPSSNNDFNQSNSRKNCGILIKAIDISQNYYGKNYPDSYELAKYYADVTNNSKFTAQSLQSSILKDLMASPHTPLEAVRPDPFDFKNLYYYSYIHYSPLSGRAIDILHSWIFGVLILNFIGILLYFTLLYKKRTVDWFYINDKK